MAILTVWLYELRARNGYGPTLAIGSNLEAVGELLKEQAGPSIEEMESWALDDRLAPLLEPFSFESAAEGQTAGVPMLDESRVEELVGSAVSASLDDEPRGRSWNLIRAESGQFALFADDTEPGLRLDVPILVRTAAAVQLRRLDPGLEIHRHGLEQQGDPALVEEICFHEIDGVEPGAAYTGRCRDDGCRHGCTPVLKVRPADGIYRLFGCNC